MLTKEEWIEIKDRYKAKNCLGICAASKKFQRLWTFDYEQVKQSADNFLKESKLDEQYCIGHFWLFNIGGKDIRLKFLDYMINKTP